MPSEISRIVNLAKQALLDKNGIDPVVLDVRRRSSFTSYFIVVHGTSDRHMRTLAENVIDELSKNEWKTLHKEGMQDGRWILLDFGEIVVHVFHHETRHFYDIERLWRPALAAKRKQSARKSKTAD